MTMIYKTILLFIAYLGASNTLEILPGTIIDRTLFPIQFPNPLDPRSFYRQLPDNTIEKIVCPLGTEFDNIQLICINTNTLSSPSGNLKLDMKLCDDEYLQKPYPESCRKYIDCWGEYGYVRTCQLNLLFSDKLGRCDWPLSANCCEYSEEDSNQIVD